MKKIVLIITFIISCCSLCQSQRRLISRESVRYLDYARYDEQGNRYRVQEDYLPFLLEQKLLRFNFTGELTATIDGVIYNVNNFAQWFVFRVKVHDDKVTETLRLEIRKNFPSDGLKTKEFTIDATHLPEVYRPIFYETKEDSYYFRPRLGFPAVERPPIQFNRQTAFSAGLGDGSNTPFNPFDEYDEGSGVSGTGLGDIGHSVGGSSFSGGGGSFSNHFGSTSNNVFIQHELSQQNRSTPTVNTLESINSLAQKYQGTVDANGNYHFNTTTNPFKSELLGETVITYTRVKNIPSNFSTIETDVINDSNSFHSSNNNPLIFLDGTTNNNDEDNGIVGVITPRDQRIPKIKEPLEKRKLFELGAKGIQKLTLNLKQGEISKKIDLQVPVKAPLDENGRWKLTSKVHVPVDGILGKLGFKAGQAIYSGLNEDGFYTKVVFLATKKGGLKEANLPASTIKDEVENSTPIIDATSSERNTSSSIDPARVVDNRTLNSFIDQNISQGVIDEKPPCYPNCFPILEDPNLDRRLPRNKILDKELELENLLAGLPADIGNELRNFILTGPPNALEIIRQLIDKINSDPVAFNAAVVTATLLTGNLAAGTVVAATPRIIQYYESEYDDLKERHPDWSELKLRLTASLNVVQTGLDVVGLVPVAGEIADGVNGVIYLARGDVGNAAISAAALWPVGGQAATLGRLAYKVVEKANGAKIALTIVLDGSKVGFGSRGKLAQVIAKNAGEEAHHIIPWNKRANDVVQQAAKDGFHMNDAVNGKALEKFKKLTGDGLHGNHPAYDKFVEKQLKNFQDGVPDFSPNDARNFLENRLIPQLDDLINQAKGSGINLNQYFRDVVNPSIGL